MKNTYYKISLFGSILFVILCILNINGIDTHNIYKNNMQSIFFSAFLTIGCLMLSLICMFMFSIKEKLFDNESYVAKLKQLSSFHNKKICRYSSLINISRAFLALINLSFITSFVQIIFGYFDHYLFSSFCITMAIVTLLFSIYILYKVSENFEVWFKVLKENEQSKE